MENSFSNSITRLPTFSFNYLEKTLSIKNNDVIINQLINDKIFMHGILISSPEFYNELKKVNKINNENKKEKIRLTLLKYFVRSTTRCIPFGLFSGIGLINNNFHDNKNTFELSNFFQKTKLDTKLSYQILNNAINNDFIKENLHYFPNSTLLPIGKKYRYIEHTLSKNAFLKFELSQINKNEYLKSIFNFSEKGKHYNDLIRLFLDEGFSYNESKSYIDDLIKNKIIVSELEASTTDTTIEKQLIRILKKVLQKSENNEIQNFYNSLEIYLNSIKSIDLLKVEDSIKETENFINTLKEIEEGKNTNTTPIHKDLYFNIKGTFNKSQNDLIVKSIDVLNTLLLESDNHLSNLHSFKDAFYNKYETKTIPLALALDIETGIGYGNTLNSSGKEDSTLINNFPNNSAHIKLEKTLKLNHLDSFLIRKIEKCENDLPIEIKEKDLESLKILNSDSNKKPINPTAIARFSLYRDKLNDKDLIYIKSIAQTSPNKILGRFSLSNNSLKKLSQEIADFEDNSFGESTIIAEIDHLPDPTPGNVIIRSKIRDYKINYIGSNNNDDKNIPISDLFLSLVGNELILFSKKHQKRVIPYFSNSYDEHSLSNIPIFKFLLDFRSQYESKKDWSIEIKKYHNLFLYIPRIVFQNIIISKESWYLLYSDFFDKKNDSLNLALQNFKTNCLKLKLPKYFVILEDDREFLININNFDLTKIFLLELKRKKQLHVQEFLLGKYNSSVIKKEGREKLQYNNEFFYPIKNKIEKSSLIKFDNKKSSESIRRVFTPGSKWIYFKIYLGSKVADDLLIDLQKTLFSLLKKKQIKSFFFIKFTDPNYHLRLRILINNKNDFSPTISKIQKKLKKYLEVYVYDIKLDTYKREMERYGGNDIIYFENIFFEDSKLVINILKSLKQNGSAKNKWLYSLIIIDVYCNLFNYSLDEKISFSHYVEDYFSKEFNSDKNTHTFINKNYNIFKEDTLFLLQNYKNIDLGFEIDEFKKNVLIQLKEISISDKEKERSFLMSIIHMHVIRLLGAHKNRVYEFMIYSIYSKSLKTLSYINKDFS